MPSLTPRYTASNCRGAYLLNWSLTIFWKSTPIPDDTWLEPLRVETEKDSVCLLEHHFECEGRASQFFLSTRPHVTPPQMVRSVKGRLQHLLREQNPKAFQRNYSLQSLGDATLDAVETYITGQIDHHQLADPCMTKRLHRYQISHAAVDLSVPRQSAHGLFRYNLHLVLVNGGRYRDGSEERLRLFRNTLLQIARDRGFLLSRAGILPDHIHLLTGCPPDRSPLEVALCFMNNLAFVHRMRPVFQYGFYVGTVGEYDRGAVWNKVKGEEGRQTEGRGAGGLSTHPFLAGNPPLNRDEPGWGDKEA